MSVASDNLVPRGCGSLYTAMALLKYFKPISSYKKCDELELPDPKDSKIPVASDVVVEINKVAKKHVHTVSHGTSS